VDLQMAKILNHGFFVKKNRREKTISKSQILNNAQTPNSNILNRFDRWSLKFEICLQFAICVLEFTP